jgi:hypothetical protein
MSKLPVEHIFETWRWHTFENSSKFLFHSNFFTLEHMQRPDLNSATPICPISQSSVHKNGTKRLLKFTVEWKGRTRLDELAHELVIGFLDHKWTRHATGQQEKG